MQEGCQKFSQGSKYGGRCIACWKRLSPAEPLPGAARKQCLEEGCLKVSMGSKFDGRCRACWKKLNPGKPLTDKKKLMPKAKQGAICDFAHSAESSSSAKERIQFAQSRGLPDVPSKKGKGWKEFSSRATSIAKSMEDGKFTNMDEYIHSAVSVEDVIMDNVFWLKEKRKEQREGLLTAPKIYELEQIPGWHLFARQVDEEVEFEKQKKAEEKRQEERENEMEADEKLFEELGEEEWVRRERIRIHAQLSQTKDRQERRKFLQGLLLKFHPDKRSGQMFHGGRVQVLHYVQQQWQKFQRAKENRLS
jgi:hypothetical protein